MTNQIRELLADPAGPLTAVLPPPAQLGGFVADLRAGAGLRGYGFQQAGYRVATVEPSEHAVAAGLHHGWIDRTLPRYTHPFDGGSLAPVVFWLTHLPAKVVVTGALGWLAITAANQGLAIRLGPHGDECADALHQIGVMLRDSGVDWLVIEGDCTLHPGHPQNVEWQAAALAPDWAVVATFEGVRVLQALSARDAREAAGQAEEPQPTDLAAVGSA